MAHNANLRRGGQRRQDAPSLNRATHDAQAANPSFMVGDSQSETRSPAPRL